MYAKPAYRVVISQLVQYLRVGCNYHDFAYRSKLLTTRFTYRQGPCGTFSHRYSWSLQKYGRCPKNIITACIALPSVWRMHLPFLTWHTYEHRAFSTPIHACACTYLHKDNTLWLLRSSDPDQTKEASQRDSTFEELLLTFWIRPGTWLHSVHEIAVPISRSPHAVKLMRPSIGQNVSCAVDDFA